MAKTSTASRSITIKNRSKLSKEEWREYTKTVWHIANVSNSGHPAVFPKEIPRRLIKLFSFWGETILDPFAGTGTTGFAAIELGRKAICVDQNPDYVAGIKESLLPYNGAGENVSAFCRDSRNLDWITENSVDLIVTSPPYWNKANYGDAKTNIGNVEGYFDFLKSIRPAFEESVRVLKPSRKMCVVTANVNQHTNHGLLTFPLATDFAVMLRELGLVMINEVIWSKDRTGGKWGSYGSQRPIFGSYPYPPNFLFKNVHEYVLIFAKPGQLRSGKTVQNYEDHMIVGRKSK